MLVVAAILLCLACLVASDDARPDREE